MRAAEIGSIYFTFTSSVNSSPRGRQQDTTFTVQLAKVGVIFSMIEKVVHQDPLSAPFLVCYFHLVLEMNYLETLILYVLSMLIHV